MSGLAAALDRLDAFCAVQRAQHGGITLEAVLNLQRAAGLDDDDRRLLLERLPAVADADRPAVLLGVVLGRLAALDARQM